jgi:hypothetical protein
MVDLVVVEHRVLLELPMALRFQEEPHLHLVKEIMVVSVIIVVVINLLVVVAQVLLEQM